MYDFGIFSHLLGLWVYIGCVVLSFVFCFCLCLFLFSFPFFLFFLFFVFCLSLGGPFNSGAPGHCPAMPPSRYAPATNMIKNENRPIRELRRPRKILFSLVLVTGDMIYFGVKSENLMKSGLWSRLLYAPFPYYCRIPVNLCWNAVPLCPISLIFPWNSELLSHEKWFLYALLPH